MMVSALVTTLTLLVAMGRNGWILPKFSSALVNRDFLDGVRQFVYYCPHVGERLPKLICVNPPPKT